MIRSNVSKLPSPDVEISSLSPNKTVEAILELLEKWLPVFRDDYLVSTPSHLEDEISESLFFFLQDVSKKNNLLFHFNAQKGVDFVIKVQPFFISAKPIFVIEAKRLPPTNNKDYVQGRTGGIERFKREQEGFSFERNHFAMVAYVQQKTFDYWLKRINHWITELIINNHKYTEINWEESDKLVEHSIKSNNVAMFTSNHSRKTLDRLTIRHFWLAMQKDPTI